MVYPYNGILFDNKKLFSTNSRYYMDESWKHAKWKKPEQYITWFHSYESFIIDKSIETENILLLKAGVGEGHEGLEVDG